jgi:hypothetical protein
VYAGWDLYRSSSRLISRAILFSGCIIVLTDRHVKALSFGRLTSRPSKTLCFPRGECSAAWNESRLEIGHPDEKGSGKSVYVVSPARSLDAQRFAETLTVEC